MSELISVLRPVMRYWYTIVIAAILGAAAIGALAYPPTESYRSVALVTNDPTAAGGNERFDFIRDLDQALSTRSVREQIADETGVPLDVLGKSLAATQASDSGFTRVQLETDDRLPDGAAELVITQGPILAAEFVIQGRVELADKTVAEAEQARDQARDAFADAEQAINDQLATNEFLDPTVEYISMQGDIADFRDELDALPPNAPERTSLQEQIDQLEADLPAAAEAANEQEILTRERENALATLNSTEQGLLDAQQAKAASSALPTVTPQTIEKKVSGTREFATTVIAGGLAAGLIATGLMAWILRRRTSALNATPVE